MGLEQVAEGHRAISNQIRFPSYQITRTGPSSLPTLALSSSVPKPPTRHPAPVLLHPARPSSSPRSTQNGAGGLEGGRATTGHASRPRRPPGHMGVCAPRAHIFSVQTASGLADPATSPSRSRANAMSSPWQGLHDPQNPNRPFFPTAPRKLPSRSLSSRRSPRPLPHTEPPRSAVLQSPTRPRIRASTAQVTALPHRAHTSFLAPEPAHATPVLPQNGSSGRARRATRDGTATVPSSRKIHRGTALRPPPTGGRVRHNVRSARAWGRSWTTHSPNSVPAKEHFGADMCLYRPPGLLDLPAPSRSYL